jgi:hypothetical protein
VPTLLEPTLLEVQRAMRASLVDREDDAAAAMLAPCIGPDRLNIYRNTFVVGVTNALRLGFPAVYRLVGADFFDGAAAIFVARHPPRAAWLDRYGSEFPAFLREFPPAAALIYLADVAALEWAVNVALRAPDAEPLDLTRLAALAREDQARVCFVPNPCLGLVSAAHPADAIWRAVLDGDDAALLAIDVQAGSVHLVVERRESGVAVTRLAQPAWRFAADLCAGRPLEEACAAAADIDAQTLLAEHLAAGRFVDFKLAGMVAPAAGSDDERPAATGAQT